MNMYLRPIIDEVNTLLAGMWFTREEPPMNMYLRPIIDEVNTLYTESIVCVVHLLCVINVLY